MRSTFCNCSRSRMGMRTPEPISTTSSSDTHRARMRVERWSYKAEYSSDFRRSNTAPGGRYSLPGVFSCRLFHLRTGTGHDTPHYKAAYLEGFQRVTLKTGRIE